MRRGPEEREGGGAVLLMVLALALMVGVGYVAAYVGARDKVPRGTSVAGVGIGGQNRSEAIRTLQAGLVPRLNEPITVTIGAVSEQLTPAQAGISVDYAATVARAGGARPLDPELIWDYYDGGDEVPPVLRVDHPRLRTLLADLSARTGTEARDGAVSFASGRAEVTEPRLGAEIDLEHAAEMLVAAWGSGDSAVALPLRISEPRIDEADLDAAVRGFANPAMSAPVTLVFAESKAKLFPRDFARLLSMHPRDGRLVPDVETADLAGLVGLVGRDSHPVDATVALVGGSPEVVPAEPGASYGPAEVRAAFLSAVARDGTGRTVRVKGSRVRADFTSRDAAAFKVIEQIASFTLPAASDADLQSAALRLSGTVLAPGETLSLNDSAGPAGAGGVALATATFNAAYLGGLVISDHTAPTAHLRGAPLGREATVTSGGVDLQVRNDGEYGVLVDAQADPGSVRVTLWSTKQWEVTTTAGRRLNLVRPTRVTLDTADCQPTTGSPGYDVRVTRTLHDLADGSVVGTVSFQTSYLPTDRVVCKAPPLAGTRG